ncbi:MAG: protein-L-isoaspartate(D-aspartate) O-methyltransferase [Gammaproteobacteria bacterium]|nr:protein-L-isoaspartate(D-aspartate) O-methyltransferase [Gammaproteobacteria bacterium]
MNSVDLKGIGMTSQRTRIRLVDRLREQGIQDERVLDVIASVPRHIFVDEALSHRAYEDTALPIGFNQTISQPYVVARMTEALLADGLPGRVLEVGTGSGYQAAVLANLVGEVYSLERIDGLLVKARKRLQLLKLNNVSVRNADGNAGWADKAPFDAIILTASPRGVPDALLEQLSIGGKLIAPVGHQSEQELTEITRTEDDYVSRNLGKVRFVPLLSGVQ